MEKKRKSKKVKGKIMIISDIMDLYRVINKVQIRDKFVNCKVKDLTLLPVIINIVRDSSLVLSVDGNKLKVSPGKEKFGQNVPFDDMEAEINEIFNN